MPVGGLPTDGHRKSHSRAGGTDLQCMGLAGQNHIAGLSREQIASKYALPQVPTHVADVSVPAGNSLRVSVANDVQIKQGLGGNGG